MQDVSRSGKEKGGEQPSWSQNFLSEGHGEGQFGGSQPQLLGQTQQEADLAPSLDFAEPELQMFDYISQVRTTAFTPPIQPVPLETNDVWSLLHLSSIVLDASDCGSTAGWSYSSLGSCSG